MRAPRSSVLGIALPLRSLLQRFALVLLIGASFALMVLGRVDTATVERARSGVMDVVGPVLDVLSRPVAAANRVVAEVRDVMLLRSELERLRDENVRLLQWQTVARRMEAENVALRQLLSVVPETLPSFVAARVIADSGAPFVRTVLVNAGHRDGVRKGQVVMNDDGVVGRVIEVGERSTRILLITDLNSRIPVFDEDSGLRGILAGDNGETPALSFLPNQAQVLPGNRIVTSGHGGLFPQGLPIGVATARDGQIRVRPYVDLHRLEYVRIIRYELPLLSPAGEERPVAADTP